MNLPPAGEGDRKLKRLPGFRVWAQAAAVTVCAARIAAVNSPGRLTVCFILFYVCSVSQRASQHSGHRMTPCIFNLNEKGCC